MEESTTMIMVLRKAIFCGLVMQSISTPMRDLSAAARNSDEEAAAANGFFLAAI